MIKKLFTLLTLALLTMPLAWGDFYLVGDINGWAKGDSYKFTDNGAGTYTLPNNAAINVSSTAFNNGKSKFKIINDNGGGNAEWTWYGSTGECNIHHNHHENILTMAGGSNNDFILQSPGLTGFSFTLDGGKPKLTVTREANLSLRSKSIENNWAWNDGNDEPMTQTSTGWTISKTNSAWREFKFIDEFGQERGGPDNTNFINLDGTNLGNNFALWTDGERFKINTADITDVIINVKSDLTQTVIYESNTVYSKSLAFIEEYGVEGKTFTVNEPLQVVYFDSTKDFAIARDLTGTTVTPNGINYMADVAKEHVSLEQYNWVMLDFNGVTTIPQNLLNGTIAGGSLKGEYTDDENYTIKVDPNATLSVTPGTEGSKYVPNVYCPANFQVDANGCQTTGYKVEWVPRQNSTLKDMVVTEASTTYWFMTPKPMEVFELSGALWNGDGFYMEKREFVPATETKPAKWINPAGLKGGIGLNKESCNTTANPNLQVGQSYRFLSVAWKKVSGSKSEASYGEPLRISLEPEPGSVLNTTIQAGALNLTGAADQIVTAVSEVKTGNDVVSVTYCDLAGRMSQKPFAGVNIIVTRYSDGTVKTTKAIK